jgi:hypothetical protein
VEVEVTLVHRTELAVVGALLPDLTLRATAAMAVEQ